MTAFLIPQFDNAFLQDVAFSVKKRRKALKYKLHTITCDKVYERNDDGQKTEKLELNLRRSLSTKDVQARLFVWSDRWVWVDARKAAKKGWEWEWTYEGRLLGKYEGRELVSAIEKALFDSSDVELNPILPEVAEVWRPLLAKGPIRVL